MPDCETFFSSDYSDNENSNIAMQLVIDILRFFIWSSKLEKNCHNNALYLKI